MKKLMIPFMVSLLMYTPTNRPQVTMLDLVAIWLICNCVKSVWSKNRAQEKTAWLQELKKQRNLLRQYCLLMQQNQCAFEKCSRQNAIILKLAHQLGIDPEENNQITRSEIPATT